MIFARSLLLALALPIVRGAVHESLDALPFGWTQATRNVSAQATVTLQAALKYQNLDKLEPMLESVSTPGNAQYGKYIDVGDLNDIFAPATSAQVKVKSWLQSKDITIQSNDGGLMTFTTTVTKANALLNATFAHYTNGATTKLRTTEYSIPDNLTDVIDFISPTTFFGNSKSQGLRAAPIATTNDGDSEKRGATKSCLQYVQYYGDLWTAECYKESFNISDYTVDISAGSTIGFGSFLNDSAIYSDLAAFEKASGLPSQNFTKTIIQNGVSYDLDNQDPAVNSQYEANMDLQNIVGLVDGLPVSEYVTGGVPLEYIGDLLYPNASTEENEPYLPYYHFLLAQKNEDLPYVISNSYADHENTVPEYYARRVCNMIGMLGLRGRTIIHSSGDEGVGAVCRANTGDKELQFSPQFPPTCPYVTAVGGTQFLDPEQAWNASSGGFSFYFPTPSYQQAAVNTYLTDHISSETKQYYLSNAFVNFSGRAFPDISAHSLYPSVLIYVNGTATDYGGTSSAAPASAAVIALLNDVRFGAGQPAVGFANPLLYSLKDAGLTDVTKGSALGCAGVDLQLGTEVVGAGIIPYASWNATDGWDPVTGLGVLNFGRLKELVINAV